MCLEAGLSRKKNNINVALKNIADFGVSVSVFWALGFVYTKAGRAAVFNQMSTVFITVLAIVVLKESLNTRKMAGLFLAVLGSIVVANS